ncbi:MAG: excinuclease ABC subunit UvrC [Candidatus Jorgensenbacteria bacterium]|nr:excinuclease ABC subunit UvrC [Candidatus Jorgensenbacteria bacterium]
MPKSLYSSLPDTPGVYLMKGARGEILYIGKAGNLRRRVSSYFLRPHDLRIEKLVENIKKIDVQKTDTALEALILEAALIKKHQPPFNIREKDDRSFLFIEITDDEYPRVLLVRGKTTLHGRRFGPFTSGGSVREAMHILRRIFPWSTHLPEKIGTYSRPCFDYEIGLCPGTCIGKAEKTEYKKNIKNLIRFLEGKKKIIVNALLRDMKTASKNLEFELAVRIRKQLFALQHIQDVSLIGGEIKMGETEDKGFRIEGYDISNISGTSAVGGMVVFTNSAGSGQVNLEPDRNEYRKFKIKTIQQSDDVGMLREMLSRRFSHKEWPIPNLVFVDGGKGQVNIAKEVLNEAGLKIPVIGIAKGPTRKKVEIIGLLPDSVDEKLLIRVRDAAHSYAISYHRTLRGKTSLL